MLALQKEARRWKEASARRKAKKTRQLHRRVVGAKPKKKKTVPKKKVLPIRFENS